MWHRREWPGRMLIVKYHGQQYKKYTLPYKAQTGSYYFNSKIQIQHMPLLLGPFGNLRFAMHQPCGQRRI